MRFSRRGTDRSLSQLIHLLQDAVTSGASVGFLPPLNAEDAQQYWRTVFQEVAQDTCVLLVARDSGRIVGSVQLALATKPNARHRAAVQKLFVLSSQRRRGIGRALMQGVEQVARSGERTLLVLDTRQGDSAEQLYRTLGYCEVGVIPAYEVDPLLGRSASRLQRRKMSSFSSLVVSQRGMVFLLKAFPECSGFHGWWCHAGAWLFIASVPSFFYMKCPSNPFHRSYVLACRFSSRSSASCVALAISTFVEEVAACRIGTASLCGRAERRA